MADTHPDSLRDDWVLGVETSGRSGSLALCRGREIVVERTLSEAGRRHAQSLVAEVSEILRGAGVRPHEIRVIGVSAGPGSFTGLRVGVVFAKTWAYATNARLVAVNTLQAIAEAAPADCLRIWVLSDAQRSDVYAGCYARRSSGESLSVHQEIAILPMSDWQKQVEAGDVVTGPGVDKLSETLPLNFLPTDLRLPRASFVARLALESDGKGCWTDPANLEPFYIRKSAAEELRDGA
jgi:tRNA threonylcarbamoyladenosine biosynthesis protein TsaB